MMLKTILKISLASVITFMALPPMVSYADNDNHWKDRRKAHKEWQKDRREAHREWEKNQREAWRERQKDRREARKDWERDRREAHRYQDSLYQNQWRQYNRNFNDPFYRNSSWGGPPGYNWQDYRFNDRHRAILYDIFSRRQPGYYNDLQWQAIQQHRNLPPGIRKKLARGGQLPPGMRNQFVNVNNDIFGALGLPYRNDLRLGVYGRDAILYNIDNGIILDILQNVVR